MTDIERWKPKRWDDFMGNEEFRDLFRDMIRRIQEESPGNNSGLLLAGPTHSSKTSITSLRLRNLLCLPE